MTNKLALIVAVVLGALSILGIKAYVERVKVQTELRDEKMEVFVAARELDEGRTFSIDDIETAQFPRAVLEQALQGTWITDKATIEGMRLKSKIKAGQILLTSHFDRGGPRNIKRIDFQPTDRAITIPISRTGGLAGMLRPQDSVDLIVSMSIKDRSGRSVQLTRTLFKGVQILATDNNINPSFGGGSYSTLTFALSPRDVNKLLFVISQGAQIHCVLTKPGTPPTKGFLPYTPELFYGEIRSELGSGS